MATLVTFVLLALVALPAPARAIAYGEAVHYDMVFPVSGDHYFTDTFGAYRSHGKGHQGTDIMAAKGTPVVPQPPARSATSIGRPGRTSTRVGAARW